MKGGRNPIKALAARYPQSPLLLKLFDNVLGREVSQSANPGRGCPCEALMRPERLLHFKDLRASQSWGQGVKEGGHTLKSYSEATSPGWHFMRGVRRVAAPALAVVVVVGLGLLVSSSRDLLTAAEEYITPRAAFLMEDDFEGGAGAGWNAPHSLVADESGAVRVEGLTLHSETMRLSSYRMDFEAKVSSGAVGWVIGAQDSENYHLYKLEKSARQSERPYRVVHYPVVGGKADTTKTVSKEVSMELGGEDFHRISVRVREGRVVTLINGQSVDYWVPQEWTAGGIGFFGNKGESSLIRYVTAYSNQDFLGLSLAAALDAIKWYRASLRPVESLPLPPSN